jgi:hypothetical protein
MFPRQITARVVPTLTNKTVGVWMADTPNGAGKAWPAPHMNTLPPGSVANVYQVRLRAASIPQYSFSRHPSSPSFSPEFCGSDPLFTQQPLTAEHEDGRSAAGSRCRCGTLRRRLPMVYVPMFSGRIIRILASATLSFSVTLTHALTASRPTNIFRVGAHRFGLPPRFCNSVFGAAVRSKSAGLRCQP